MGNTDRRPASETGETIAKAGGGRRKGAKRGDPVAGLLVARSPVAGEDGAPDRVSLDAPCSVGRGSACGFKLADRQVSHEHFRVGREGGAHAIEDLGSTNGTSVNGDRLKPGEKRPLTSPSVIRAGDTVLVFLDNAEPLLGSRFLGDRRAFDMAGPFHDGALLVRLKESAASRRPPLLAGPSGVGKELAAAALARFWGLRPPLRYNASASASPEEMSRALFGVAAGAFTGVEKRDGLIVAASRAGQPLFLDEVHHLPLEAQATLLTVIEDRKFARKGAEDKELEVDVRFVFASNEPDKLKPDLRARLWVVDVPPLRDRVADVPALFDALLARCLAAHGAKPDAVRPGLDSDLYHDLCLAALGGRFDATNVRGLLDLADRIAARVATGGDPADAVDSVLAELGLCSAVGADSDGAGGQYEAHRELIEAVYRGCGRNAKKTVDLFRESGVPWTISRRHLNKYLARWGFGEE